jgi:hypothetical protein
MSSAETDLVEAKALTPRIPREGSEQGIELLGGIPEACQVFAQDDDNIRTKPFCI